VAAAATEPPPVDQPVLSPASQSEFEAVLVEFLRENPAPESGDFAQSADGRNEYWRTVASWWDRVPWDAVAGQWGCTAGGVSVTFNPPDAAGVSSAGYGGVIDCGTRYSTGTIPLLTEPIPRSQVEDVGQ
jgi:hypothetical protein